MCQGQAGLQAALMVSIILEAFLMVVRLAKSACPGHGAYVRESPAHHDLTWLEGGSLAPAPPVRVSETRASLTDFLVNILDDSLRLAICLTSHRDLAILL